MISQPQQTVVVIGNGMVGHRFCEKLIEYDATRKFKLVSFCEEPRAAYDRVGLTSFFAHRDAERLMLARIDWYRDHGVELHIGDRASRIDRKKRIVHSEKRVKIRYDYVVLATGSYPFVPDVEGIHKHGVFVYRTIEDLEKIIQYGERAKGCAVIGGGLLGLEAAKAAYDLNLETHVVEFAGRLMPRQIDDVGSSVLVKKIEDLGVHVHLNKSTKAVLGDGAVRGMLFQDGQQLDVEMIIVSAGIRPRDELARDAGLDVGQRGGVTINDQLQTSDPNIYAIGEVALHGGMIYGLVAPGYDMANVVAANLCGGEQRFTGASLSTKLKLMGVDVASFGQYELPLEAARPLVYHDPFGGRYKKLFFNHEGTRLLGGILVGDAADYAALSALAGGDAPLPAAPGELVYGAGGSSLAGAEALADDAQVCSCNNVRKCQILSAIRQGELGALADVKRQTKAGTGCGGCLPLVSDLLAAELKAAGKSVNTHLCEHFSFSRVELYEIVKIKQLRSFSELVADCGTGAGCEICKPAVASILASLWNESIIEPAHQTLQDTNDRFLANMQRGGLYSVIPRVPGGEITPEKLIVLGRVAKRYGLYTKITGAQRIDLFGARVQDLPEIWEQLVEAGFESGHAYGKALRTVKSCVGTTWCRYGVQDSVSFAIEIENRYKGIRAPHKLKGGVSGCIRECAEAQSKDFGLVATERGYNLYVGGNGGARPRHADLLAADLDNATCIRYLDRFLMYYIQTADKLTRTAVWLEKLAGGVDYLRQVIIDDKLGICEDLERQMAFLVDSYKCEWAEVVRDPEKRRLFRQFVNTDESEPCIELVDQRGQQRPGDWPPELVSIEQVKLLGGAVHGAVGTSRGSAAADPAGETSAGAAGDRTWVWVGKTADFPPDGGATIKYGQVQIAVFNFASRGKWYASQNMCPHRKAFVLSRGIIGDVGGAPKVACPLHKKTFSLDSGQCTSGDDYQIRLFDVKVESGDVYLLLPPEQDLDQHLATHIGCTLATACEAAPEMLTV